MGASLCYEPEVHSVFDKTNEPKRTKKVEKRHPSNKGFMLINGSRP